MNRGVIYYAQGKKFLDEFAVAVKTFKRFNPTIPVVLFTPDDVRVDPKIARVIQAEDFGNPFKNKVNAITQSPFEYTLYLDTDTLIRSSLYEVFDFLLNYDMAIANRVLCEWGKKTIFRDYVDAGCYNTGVFAFKKSAAVELFFDKWRNAVMRRDNTQMWSGHFGDQHFFNELVFNQRYADEIGLHIVALPNKKYNARPHMFNQLKADCQFNEIKIFHAHFETGLTQKINVLLNKAKMKFGIR